MDRQEHKTLIYNHVLADIYVVLIVLCMSWATGLYYNNYADVHVQPNIFFFLSTQIWYLRGCITLTSR